VGNEKTFAEDLRQKFFRRSSAKVFSVGNEKTFAEDGSFSLPTEKLPSRNDKPGSRFILGWC
jgi:hypothetical protein